MYPNVKQAQKLNKTFGCVRFMWNQSVASFKEKLDVNLNALKELYPFLNEISCATLQQKQRDFIEFKKQFFNKTRKVKIEKPQFKKKGQNDSFRLPNQKVKVLDNKIQLEKIGKISYVKDRGLPIDCKLLSITVSKNSSGQYFASVLVECLVEELPKTNQSVGIDLGLKSFVITSDGKEFDSNKKFRESQSKLRIAQKHLSRKVKGSSRFKKCKRQVAKIHQKIANQRSHYLHQITNEIVNNYDTIVIEDLNVKGMVKNRKLSKSISDASFSAFRQQLAYKCAWYGKKLIVADRFFASSKTCSGCGTVKKDLTLSQRTYNCEACGIVLDRDFNAALNLKNIADRVLAA